ncbi:MAG: alkaline phosphatase family protein [Parafilimonas sp.]
MKKISHIIFVAATFILAACNKQDLASLHNTQSQSHQKSEALAYPIPDHIVVLILENHAYNQIIGSPQAPYINSLAKDTSSANFTNSYGIEHPSQPNYLDLYSGSNQGVHNDNHPRNEPFATANLGRQLIDKNKTYLTYSEDLPSVGFNGNTSGKYARKHNPATNWMGTDTNQMPSTTNQPYTAFPTDYTQLPTACFVVPNLNNDMHEGSISKGDTWVQNNMDAYIQWTKTHNSLFILTFDEDDSRHANHITTIFTGEHVKAGGYLNKINHYNILRTIEDAYQLPYAGNAATATPITYCWK